LPFNRLVIDLALEVICCNLYTQFQYWLESTHFKFLSIAVDFFIVEEDEAQVKFCQAVLYSSVSHFGTTEKLQDQFSITRTLLRKLGTIFLCKFYVSIAAQKDSKE